MLPIYIISVWKICQIYINFFKGMYKTKASTAIYSTKNIYFIYNA